MAKMTLFALMMTLVEKNNASTISTAMKNRLQTFTFLRTLIVLSITAAVALPVYTVFFLFPSFSDFHIENAEKEALRLANHLASGAIVEESEPSPSFSHSEKTFVKKSLPDDFSKQVKDLADDFGLIKVKVFSPSGEIIYSTTKGDIGSVNSLSYFHDIIAKGNQYTKVIKKNTSTLEGNLISTDVMETYVPIMNGENFLGAFEIYYDLSQTTENLNNLLYKFLFILTFIFLLLLTAIIISAFNANKSFIQLHRTEEELRTERDFSKTVINTVSALVMVLDKKGNVLHFNRKCQQVAGYASEEVVGRKIWDILLLQEEVEPVKRFLDEVIQKNTTNTFDTHWIKKDKEHRLISWTNTALSNKDGEVTHIISTGIDITENRKIHNMIIKAKEDWELTFNTIDDAVTIHDDNNTIIQANKGTEKLIGLPLAEIIGKKCYQVFHGSDSLPADCFSCSQPETNTSRSIELFEPHLQKYVEVKVFPRIAENNRTVGKIHIIRDINKRKWAEKEQQKLQKQLIQSQKMEAVGQLAGGVAHDFNNLLTGIIGFASLAYDQVGDNTPVKDDLKETLQLSKKASSLTRQLLAFSKRQILEHEVVNLNDLVNNMSKMLMRIIGEDITFQFSPAENLGVIMADPGQIEQILVNLAINSRHAMPEGGSLSIATCNTQLDEKEGEIRQADIPPGPYTLLSFSDTGFGIAQEIQEQIFDPFFTTKEVGVGSGLGLSTAYGIVKQHKGFIWVESKAGHGATFLIYLPQYVDEEKLSEKETVRSPQEGTPTILIVEDDVAVLHVTQRMLINLGYMVLIAADPDEAEEVYSRNKDVISLLLTDVILPKKNGKELYRILAGENPDLKVVYMSGHTQDVIVQKGILDTDTPFIKKPFTQEILETKIQSILFER